MLAVVWWWFGGGTSDGGGRSDSVVNVVVKWSLGDTKHDAWKGGRLAFSSRRGQQVRQANTTELMFESDVKAQ